MDLGSMNEMLASVLFSAFGVGYFIYGKKQAQFLMLGAGMALMLYPYFVSGVATIILVGLALMAVPFILARFL
ncbi:hypothetical protein MNBD_NITROSPINAE01-1949 [hydrothermal vent metagenome]|uniref:Amino acid transport protein n=1 Tax=hydrothermal vent metagenome TaxID=652676 RepID=A0A3B1BAY3_9ZZZZ